MTKRCSSWLKALDPVRKVGGVEGTGSYGAGLARDPALVLNVQVIELIARTEPNADAAAKSDPLDAVEAARAALGGRAKGISSSKSGAVEAIRVLVVAKRSARGARDQGAQFQMRHLVITAPDQLRCRLRGSSVIVPWSTRRPRLRPSRSGDAVMAAPQGCAVLRWPGGSKALGDELAEPDPRIEVLVPSVAPELLARFGVGPDTAAALLVSAGDNPERLHSEAAWAHLCGVAPIPASSGKNCSPPPRLWWRPPLGSTARCAADRHRSASRSHPDHHRLLRAHRAKDVARAVDVIRLLKRYVARELDPLLASRLIPRTVGLAHPQPSPLGVDFLANSPATGSVITLCERVA